MRGRKSVVGGETICITLRNAAVTASLATAAVSTLLM
jgi:hypothetical protein